ncbi:hypothetical protein AB0L44_46145 [Nonomuraea wenchangensis]
MIQTLPRVIATPSGKPVPEGGAELRRLARSICLARTSRSRAAAT